jgi:hypothetical protein
MSQPTRRGPAPRSACPCEITTAMPITDDARVHLQRQLGVTTSLVATTRPQPARRAGTSVEIASGDPGIQGRALVSRWSA